MGLLYSVCFSTCSSFQVLAVLPGHFTGSGPNSMCFGSVAEQRLEKNPALKESIFGRGCTTDLRSPGLHRRSAFQRLEQFVCQVTVAIEDQQDSWLIWIHCTADELSRANRL